MAEQKFNVNCGFFDSYENDRLYSANEMNRPYKRIITNGVFATPQGTTSSDLQVISANNGMNILVKPGEGMFGDKWFENPSDIAITVPSNTSVVPRKDSVIVQIDNRLNGRTGNIVYREGTPSSNPQAPDINTLDSVIEYRIANIYVGANVNIINNDVITDLRGSSDCPWITSLIKQVDTSTLFNQWQNAYETYYNESTEDFQEYTNEQREAWEQFLDNLTSDLSVATNVIMFTNNYISIGTVSNVPIGIPSYDPETDVLMVFINGLRVTEGLNYTINSNKTSIDLKIALTSGQAVNFLVLKSVIAADIQSTVTLIQALNTKLDNYMSDTGWIPLTLTESYTTFDENTTPSYRKVGNTIYLRGAISITNNNSNIISNLPINCCPEMEHNFIVALIENDTHTGNISIEVDSNGNIKLISIPSSISENAKIYLSTSYTIG